MVFEVEVNHTRTAALAPSREAHARLADAPGSLDDVALFRVVLQLVLEDAVIVIIDQNTESFGKIARFNKGQRH